MGNIIGVWGYLGVAVRWGWNVLKLAASSFYHKPREKTEKGCRDADLRDRIGATCLEFPRYGYRWVTEALKLAGIRINRKGVLRIMKDGNLHPG